MWKRMLLILLLFPLVGCSIPRKWSLESIVRQESPLPEQGARRVSIDSEPSVVLGDPSASTEIRTTMPASEILKFYRHRLFLHGWHPRVEESPDDLFTVPGEEASEGSLLDRSYYADHELKFGGEASGLVYGREHWEMRLQRSEGGEISINIRVVTDYLWDKPTQLALYPFYMLLGEGVVLVMPFFSPF